MTNRASVWFLAVAALLWFTPAMATDLGLPARRKPAAVPVPAAVDAFAPPDATCMEWTDGCRTCQKPPAGEAICSNVGIACVSQALRCTRR